MPKVAFVFPGQGSQSLAILRSFIPHFTIIQSTFLEASKVLGYDLWTLAQHGPLDKINQTIYTQPLILTASVALWRLWRECSQFMPRFLVGHSLGEYSAYTCAGSLGFQEAVQLVSKRGLYMQKAVPPQAGAMAVIELPVEAVTAICEQVSHKGYVTLANYNTTTQIIISGDIHAVNSAISVAKQSGAKLARKIPVSVPAHSLLMKHAAQCLSATLDRISFLSPRIPIFDTVQLQQVKTAHTIKERLVKQLYSPVRWSDSIQLLITQGVDYFIECGSGQVLRRLIQEIAPSSVTVISLCEYENFCKALNGLEKSDTE